MEIKVGTIGEATAQVARELTAKAVGSGSLLVYATPCMIALMEEAACKALEGCLEEGQTTVGTQMAITHDAATPVGMDVSAKAEITAVDGRKISYTVTAFDEKGQIGSGTHTRFIIKEESFLAKTYDKL